MAIPLYSLITHSKFQDVYMRLFITKLLCNQTCQSEMRQHRLYDDGSFYVPTSYMIERTFENVKGNYVPVLEVHTISYQILCPIYRTYHSNCGIIIMSCFFPIGRIFNIEPRGRQKIILLKE